MRIESAVGGVRVIPVRHGDDRSIPDILQQIETSVTARKKMLDTLTNVTSEFKRVEYGRLKADALNSYRSVPFYHLIIKKDTSSTYKNQFEKSPESAVNNYGKGLVNASFLKLGVYRDVGRDLIKAGPPAHDVQIIKDWYATDFIDTMKRVNDKKKLAPFHKQINKIQTASYKNAPNKTLQELLKSERGSRAVDFTAADKIVKNEVKQSFRKNNLCRYMVYLVRALYAGNTLFEKLKEEYKDDLSVVFVSLFIDCDTIGWRKNVEAKNARGFNGALPSSGEGAKSIDVLH